MRGYYIRFVDGEVLRVLLANSLGDGTGVIMTAAPTIDMGTIFMGNTVITSFNELHYFTRANTNPVASMFKGCTHLASVDLSETTVIESQ